jgi:hypothetical protein
VLIIVDGPDCSGKSTLVNRLVMFIEQQYPGEYVRTFHRSAPTSHPLGEYVEPLLGYRPGQGVHVVIDRWHWGESIYPGLFSRPTQMDAGVRRYIEMFLRSRGAMVVYPQTEPDELVRRHRLRGDAVVTETMLMRLNQEYRAVAMQTLLPVFRYRADGPGEMSQRARTIIQEAGVYATTAMRLNALATYVGPPRPNFLLVGDERPPRMDRDHPAFMPYAPRSGHYLLNALRGPRLTNLGIVNANDVDDVGHAWQLLGCPANVVALGRLAHRRLVALEIEHAQVPHPQFMRRFYQKHRDEYGSVIADALTDSHVDRSSWRPATATWSAR